MLTLLAVPLVGKHTSIVHSFTVRWLQVSVGHREELNRIPLLSVGSCGIAFCVKTRSDLLRGNTEGPQSITDSSMRGTRNFHLSCSRMNPPSLSLCSALCVSMKLSTYVH